MYRAVRAISANNYIAFFSLELGVLTRLSVSSREHFTIMMCNILNSLYLKSNGDIRCDDDFGEQIVLGSIGGNIFSPTKLLNNSLYTHIRDSYSKNQMPFPDICSKCALFSSGTLVDSFRNRIINRIQIEISLLCDLTCSGCSREAQIQEGRKPFLLSLKKMDVFLEGLVREKFTVKEFEFCGQGEPLNHPQFNLICQSVNKSFPRANVRLITNANFHINTINGCKIDELIASIDGASLNGYGVYRRNGNLNTAINFLRDVRTHYKATKIVWKYILFDGNDSDDEIIHAQVTAKKIGVDELRFVLTRYGPYSHRYSTNDFRNFPILSELVRIDSHPFITTTSTLADIKIRSFYGFGFITPFMFNLTKLLANQCINRVSIDKKDSYDELFIDGLIRHRLIRNQMFIIFQGNHYPIHSMYSIPPNNNFYKRPGFNGLTEKFRIKLNIMKGISNEKLLIKCGYFVGCFFIGRTYEINFTQQNSKPC